MATMDFRWIEAGRLAGCSMPGMFAETSADLAHLRGQGIHHLVSLTESPLEPVPESGLVFHHFPIDDMGVPQPRATESLCRNIVRWLAAEQPVAVHCKAGIGRTGTILACCLVAKGFGTRAAISAVRRVNRLYVQTDGQERFVGHFEEHFLSSGSQNSRSAEGSIHDGGAYPNGLPRLRLKLPTESAS